MKRRRVSRIIETVAKAPKQPDEFYSLTEPSYEERINGLAGKTSYRAPASGHSTKAKAVPGDHVVAGSLAYARRHRGDFGPDIAVAVALKSDARMQKCVHTLALLLAKNSQSIDVRPFLYAAMCAWEQVVHAKSMPAPKSMQGPAWDGLMKVAISVMEGERQAAIREARAAA